MDQAHDKKISMLVLVTSVLLCGVLSVCLGKELNWDLANYHYYNPFAFLYQRSQLDVWPTEHVHVFFTPTLDFLTYFLITHFPPMLTVFVMGALHGINFWLIYCIAVLLLRALPQTNYVVLTALTITFLSFYAPIVIPGIGSFQQDLTVSLFVLTSVYLQLKCLCDYSPSRFNPLSHESGRGLGRGCVVLQHSLFSMEMIFISGIILGLGIGLKLTVAVFAVGSLIAWLLSALSWRDKFKFALWLVVGVAIGMVITSGYWMWFLWNHYQNPFYPLWNGIFKSPSFPAVNWGDHRYHPQGLLQQLFFPFYFSWELQTLDAPFRDVRYLVLYVVFAVFACVLLWHALTRTTREKIHPAIKWLFVFFIATYLIWQCYFSILRYIVTLEMLAPLTIYLVLSSLLRSYILRVIMASVLFFLMTVLMISAPMVRAPWYQADYFNVQMPDIATSPKEAVVLMPLSAYAFGTTPRPQFYLIPFFPAKWRFVGVPFSGMTYTVPPQVTAILQQGESLPVYLMASPEYMEAMRRVARTGGMKPVEKCVEITSDRQAVTNEQVMLCPVKK